MDIIVYIAAIVFFILANAADLLTTRAILSRGGEELNPVVNRLAERFGLVGAFAILKGASVVLVAAVGIVAYPVWVNYATMITILAALFSVVAAGVNVKVINQMRERGRW